LQIIVNTTLRQVNVSTRPAYASWPVAQAETPRIDAVYAHMPFCTTKCHYCDFYSLAGHLDQADAYLDALEREAALQARQLPMPARPETIFIGGGTPTLLEPPHLERMLRAVTRWLDLSALREFTIEANPNTFSPERAEVLARAGVNRISFGAQSFVGAELAALQRDHDPQSVAPAMAMARAAGISNINLDLIFGIPGQTVDTWDYSLGQALELGTQHISCYSLMYEPNTKLTARKAAGDVVPMPEEDELRLFEHVYAKLRAAGFERYEVSNYARPGQECRHNLHYWTGGNWLALGPSAAAKVGAYKWKNVGSLAHYLEALAPADAVLPLTAVERLAPGHAAGELAMLWLRLASGMDYAAFEKKTGIAAKAVVEQALARYARMGLVDLLPERAVIREHAVVLSDTLLGDVLAAFTARDVAGQGHVVQPSKRD